MMNLFMKTFHRDCMIPMKPVGISTMCVVMPIGRYLPDHSGRPGYGASFGADGRKKAWWDALEDPGFNQMKYLKNLMLTFPFFERVPDQSVIAGTNGERYDRAIATRGNDYLLVYNYSGRPMQIDLSKISGAKKNAWWYSAKDGKLEYIGEFDSKVTSFQHDSGYLSGNDQVLIVVDSAKDYVQKAWTALPDAIQKWNK